MTRARRFLARLGADRAGAALVEFAIVAPVMILLLMGLGDILYQEYVQAILTGAAQKAARDSTIAAADTTAIDTKVMAVVQTVAHNATYVSSRKSYDNFSEIKPEQFIDANNNNAYDSGECFYDANANGSWDADPGAAGQGGASAAALYTITVTYPRLFPMAGLMGWSSSNVVSATTLLKNQPYASQSVAKAVWTKGGGKSC